MTLKEALEQSEEHFFDSFYRKLPYRSLGKDYSNPDNVNGEICAKCGGECCKRCGCEFSPDDFKEISFDYLKSQIEKGYISIAIIDSELIYNDIDILILRARNKNSPIIDFFTSNSPCILLTSTGCKLDYEHRPSGGKLMVPSENYSENFFGCKVHKCFSPYTIEDCCYEWEPHQKVLHELATYFFKKDYHCSL